MSATIAKAFRRHGLCILAVFLALSAGACRKDEDASPTALLLLAAVGQNSCNALYTSTPSLSYHTIYRFSVAEQTLKICGYCYNNSNDLGNCQAVLTYPQAGRYSIALGGGSLTIPCGGSSITYTVAAEMGPIGSYNSYTQIYDIGTVYATSASPTERDFSAGEQAVLQGRTGGQYYCLGGAANSSPLIWTATLTKM